MFNTVLLILIPFVTLFLPEAIIRGSLAQTLAWISGHPTQFIVSYAVLFGLINIFYVLPRKIYGALGVLVAALFAVAGFISHQKLILRGEPLLPWDFRIGKEALNISQSVELLNPMPSVLILMAGVLVVVVLVGFRLLPREDYRFPQKLSTSLLSLALFLTLVQPTSLQNAFSLNVYEWNQKAHYEENGMVLGFLLNMKCLSVPEPGCYQEDTIEDIIYQSSPAYAVNPDFSPNIIMVMSEAFWDPTVMDEVTFSEDPLPYFHSLQQSCTTGVMLAPVYGGGTANTEFEILTGLSTQFLPQGVIPYVQYVHKPLEALPAILTKQGYEATAIHTYDDWFYRRNSVYQDLGFDRFISKNAFIKPEYYGSYIRDTELSQRILHVLGQTAKPDFIFAVSMQAHGPYSSEENLDSAIKVSGDLKKETRAVLENYTNIIFDVDKSLEILIEELKLIDEPTLVVFFGDHLPMLGNNFDVYKEANYMQNEYSYTDYLNKYSVPILVWDNFAMAREDLRLSSNFLGSYVLACSMKTGSSLTDFLSTLNEKGSNLLAAAQYRCHESISEEECAHYALLQYDFLIGNEYVYRLNPLHKPQANHQFALGHGPVVIEKVLCPDKNMLEVLGMDFSQNHIVYVNDIPVDTEFIDENLLKATLPVSDSNKSEPVLIQVKLTDRMKNVITESNVYAVLDPSSPI